MRTFTRLLVAGTGTLAIAGAALAAADRAHVMAVALPDGSVAHIRYVGDVAPNVVVAPVAASVPAGFADGDPFALFDRISFAMDRQMTAMLQQASALAAMPATVDAPLDKAAVQGAPGGSVSYSYTSYSSGNGAACSQSVQVTSLGTNQAPKVVRQSAGDCTAVNSRAPTPTAAPAKPAGSALTPVVLHKAPEQPAKGPVI